ncbi:unnamed protein product [Caenorhabditis angaria]|uniref:Nuclear receptor domain-containing protein n=1 Tax=Caenorhabditis angaria TaxID=860376 RepID=A0A9P1IUM6_9PELO|nr:unnamed protein product [Caenorhabditis angaria]
MSAKQKCLVCNETADSLHFGALSCRACAAFFRRNIASKKQFRNSCERKCSIDMPHLRKLCQVCRFEKCLAVGMKETSVLSRVSYSKALTSTEEKYTFLNKLIQFYDKIENSRDEVFQRKKEYSEKFKL